MALGYKSEQKAFHTPSRSQDPLHFAAGAPYVKKLLSPLPTSTNYLVFGLTTFCRIGAIKLDVLSKNQQKTAIESLPNPETLHCPKPLNIHSGTSRTPTPKPMLFETHSVSRLSEEAEQRLCIAARRARKLFNQRQGFTVADRGYHCVTI